MSYLTKPCYVCKREDGHTKNCAWIASIAALCISSRSPWRDPPVTYDKAQAVLDELHEKLHFDTTKF